MGVSLPILTKLHHLLPSEIQSLAFLALVRVAVDRE
jgi:hypothetical protein